MWCIVVAWVFPLQAKFYNKVKETMRNALYCGIGYLPRTAMMVVMNMLPWVLLYYATSWFLQFGCVWIMIWFSLAAYVNCKLLEKPFERFTGEETVPAETKA